MTDEIPIEIELGSGGLYYGTSPQMKGLLVTGKTIQEVMERVPNAIAEMRAVAAMGPEISLLRSELREAREIMKRVDGEMFEMGHRLPCMADLRAFLTKDKADG